MLSNLELIKVEENQVEESQNTIKGKDNGEEEGFENIRWINDIIEIK